MSKFGFEKAIICAKGCPHPEFEVLWIMDFSQATHSWFCNDCDHSLKFTSFVLLVYIVWVLRIKSVLSFLYSNVFHFCFSWFCNDSDHLQKFTSSPRLHSLGFKDKESIKSEGNKLNRAKIGR